MQSHIANPEYISPVGNGWEMDHEKLAPFYFEGESSSEMLNEIVCHCRGRSMCKDACTCVQNSMPCIELCSCEASDKCVNYNVGVSDTEGEWNYLI